MGWYKNTRAAGLCVSCGVLPAVIVSGLGGNGGTTIKYCQECRTKINLARSEKRHSVKKEVLSHYGPGGHLNCCWEECSVSDPDMLTLDHENNDGNEARKGSYKGGVSFYSKVKREGYPDGLRTLCHNHQWKKEIMRRREDLNGTPTWRK